MNMSPLCFRLFSHFHAFRCGVLVNYLTVRMKKTTSTFMFWFLESRMKWWVVHFTASSRRVKSLSFHKGTWMKKEAISSIGTAKLHQWDSEKKTENILQVELFRVNSGRKRQSSAKKRLSGISNVNVHISFVTWSSLEHTSKRERKGKRKVPKLCNVLSSHLTWTS